MARTKRPARKAAAPKAADESVVEEPAVEEIPAEEADASVEDDGNPVNERELMTVEEPDNTPKPKRFQPREKSASADEMIASASEEKQYKNKALKMRAVLAAQEQVRIRVAKVHGPQTVIINGVRFNIPTNVYVSVPLQVATMLEDAEVI